MTLAGKLIVSAALVAAVSADVYLHNPRGSNNRLDEARRDRNNANRLFDSQNNNRGGSNVGSLYFYEGEKVPMEWTNQHGCGSTQNNCQMVVQYMCDNRLRDGVTTRTIPQTPSQCLNNDCNTDTRYGMHEDYDYYMNCKYRFRNRGLFTADRNLQGNTAKYTRQNNNGARRGYECPEERDYYPYWHPTDWVDLAIQTNDPSRCEWYQAESENVKGRWYCALPDAWYHSMVSAGGNGRQGFIPNTQARCMALNRPTSAMMTFLSTQAMAYTQELNTMVEEELKRCTDQMMVFANLCPGSTDPATCTAATDFFGVASNFITDTALMAACPMCNGTDALHPYSECPMCGPAECATNSSKFMNKTANDEGELVCEMGYVEDSASDWCIATECANSFTMLSPWQQESVDTCKTMAIGTKILVSGTSVSNYACYERSVRTASCVAAANQATWVMKAPHSERIPGLGAPQCAQSQWSRANHLGNGVGGQQNGWNFTVPSHIAERCAIRVRYNITTADYGAMDPHNSGEVNSTMNKNNGNNPAKVNLAANFDIPTTMASMPYENSRGYLWRNNPRVSIFDFSQMVRYCPGGPSENRMPDQNGFPTQCMVGTQLRVASSAFCPAGTVMVNPQGAGTFANPCAGTGDFCQKADGTRAIGIECKPGTGAGSRGLNNNGLRNQGNTANGDKDFRLQLAINTNQFGRTFQDRTHSHAFRAVTEELRQDCRRIHALNVRGKRGNIVQTYPGTEYDFVPNILEVSRGDCVHFQWTGSNTNPNNNDGQGKRGTDRSNVALLENVRGEGGRGVLRYGGAGRDGTKWTTSNMEPGYEGFQYNTQPTMFDVQCDSSANTARATHPFNVPYPAWRYCSSCNASSFRGTLSPTSQACPVGFQYLQCRMCGGQCCPGTMGICHRIADSCSVVDRPANPTTYTGVGLDARDPGFAGFSSQQIGVMDGMKFGGWGNSHPEHLKNVSAWNVWGMSRDTLTNLATLKNVQFRGEMSELDDAGTYYDLPPQRIGGPTGSMYYMCTRNNNFSNRSQKGKIIVSDNVEESMPCSSTGCDVAASSAPLLADAGLMTSAAQAATEGSVTVTVPPQSLQNREQVSVMMVSGSGMSDASSDIVMVAPGDLRSTPKFMTFQLEGQMGGGRRRQSSDGMSGIWVTVQQPDQGSNKLWIEVKSPDSGIIAASRQTVWEWLTARGQTMWEPWMCINLGYGSQWWSVQIGIPGTNVINYEITIPESERAAINAALWDGSLRLMAGFPSEMDVNMTTNATTRSCSVNPFTGRVQLDPESGRPITLTIPVAAAFNYGAIYRWPVNNRTTACFMDGIGCDSVFTDDSRETIDDASCSGGTCTLQRSQAGGYYQVSSSNTLALVIGITFGVLVFSALLVGGALYFRRNPEKWDAVKAWGPNKYKELGRSLQSRV